MCRVENSTNKQPNKLYPSLSSPSTTSFLRKYVFKKREGKKLLGVISVRSVPFHSMGSIRCAMGSGLPVAADFSLFIVLRVEIQPKSPIRVWDYISFCLCNILIAAVFSFRFVLKAAVDRFKYVCGVPVGSWQLSAETLRQYVCPIWDSTKILYNAP